MCGADTVAPSLPENATGSPPHVRGRRKMLQCPTFPHGSPPHVRGRHVNAGLESADDRFTPACAGQTPSFCRNAQIKTVHPRMCGADHTLKEVDTLFGGSPPHVRGRRRGGFRHHERRRFTPACAGQTRRAAYKRASTTVHPRMCGADLCPVKRLSLSHGSPPHVRGRLRVTADEAEGLRFTPACAGQTQTYPYPGLARPVHPRMCGADNVNKIEDCIDGGSPPHVRGRLRSLTRQNRR